MFPAVRNGSVVISWNCDDDSLNDEESDEDETNVKKSQNRNVRHVQHTKKFIYCVEMKKTTESEEEWKEVYRGKDKKCTVSVLEKGDRIQCG